MQITLVAGLAVQFHECKFDFLMPRHPHALALAERRVDMVGKAYCCVQKFVLAGSVIICDGSLDEVTCAIHLVHCHVAPTLVYSGYYVVRGEVAVGQLRCGYAVDYLVYVRLQFCIGTVHERIGHAFQNRAVEMRLGVE